MPAINPATLAPGQRVTLVFANGDPGGLIAVYKRPCKRPGCKAQLFQTTEPSRGPLWIDLLEDGTLRDYEGRIVEVRDAN